MKYSLAATTFLLLGSTAAAFQSPSPHTRIPRSTQITPQTFSHQHTTTTTSTTALSAAPLAVAASSLSGITAPIGSISVLAFVILIHEGGHFLAARSQGIKVQEFSVGVGPKLFGFTRGGTPKSKHDGTTDEDDIEEDDDQAIEFNLRAIPLGGYVRFPENYNATLEYQVEVEADRKRAEIQSIIEENRDATGTGNSNGLLSSINILANQKKREEERIAALETMALQMTNSEPSSSQPWWQKNPFASKSKAKDAEEEKKKSIIINEDGTVSTPPIDYYDDVDLLQNRPPLQRALVLVGGVVFNILLAFTLYFGELTVGNGLQKPIFSSGAVISAAPRVNSASVGLLDKGDVILALNGTYV
jgi:membrane-associated protease RseP (regulator of RpoE activity)